MAKSKNKEPRLWEIVVAAILSLIVGLLGAVAFLVTLAPEEVSELPEPGERELGRVYLIKGEEGDSSHATWEAKEEAVKAQRSGEISVVEEELNQWAEARLGGDGEGSGEASFLHVESGVPNFRLEEGELFVSIPLTWNLFGFAETFESQTSGTFRQRGGSFEFDHDRVYVGSCPLPDFFAKRLVRDVIDSFQPLDELREGWANLENVSLEEEELALVIP